MKTYTKFEDVPLGFYIMRAQHEKAGAVHHLCLKVDNQKPWHDQINVPANSEAMKCSITDRFWEWAKENMPIWEYPDVIKSCA